MGNVVSWGNVEKFVRQWLGEATGRPVYRRLPADPALTERLPVYLVRRVGGSQYSDISKGISVEVDTLGGDAGSLWEHVDQLENAMYALSANGSGEFYVDDVVETFSPTEVDHGNPDITRATATYTLTIRPRVLPG